MNKHRDPGNIAGAKGAPFTAPQAITGGGSALRGWQPQEGWPQSAPQLGVQPTEHGEKHLATAQDSPGAVFKGIVGMSETYYGLFCGGGVEGGERDGSGWTGQEQAWGNRGERG